MRGFGCLPDPDFLYGSHSFAQVCGLSVGEDAVDLSHLCAPVSDQGTTESCTGHAWANAICQTLRRSNPVAERPSALLLYDMGRGLLGQRGVDVGLPLGILEQAARVGGFAPESAVPFDERRIFDHIFLDEYYSAMQQIGMRSHRLSINPRVGIPAAISAGCGVAIGMDVDLSFCDFVGSDVWTGMAGPRLGGHAMSVCGYSPSGIVAINSWGLDWGYAGFATIGWDYIVSEHCRSVWIVDAVPEYR